MSCVFKATFASLRNIEHIWWACLVQKSCTVQACRICAIVRIQIPFVPLFESEINFSTFWRIMFVMLCWDYRFVSVKIVLPQSWTSLCRVWHVSIQMSQCRRLVVWLCHFDSFVAHVALLIKWRVGSESALAETPMTMVLSGSCKKWRSAVCFGAAPDPLLGQGEAFKLQRHCAQSSRFGRLR